MNISCYSTCNTYHKE